MEEVGVRELRQNLSVWLRRVKEGGSFRVTGHGRPVALLTAAGSASDDLADLIAAGIISPPADPTGPFPAPHRPAPGGPQRD